MAMPGCAGADTAGVETCTAQVPAAAGASTERGELQLTRTTKSNILLLENNGLLETKLSVACASAD